MVYKFTVPGRFESFNEYVGACRTSAAYANRIKKQNESVICWEIKKAHIPPIKKPVALHYTWYEENQKRDLDNIVFAQKYFQDAMVNSGILENDGQKWIKSLSHQVILDREKPRIEVTIEEVEDKNE